MMCTQICDDSDEWADKKLGHHYVRINNKTIEIRYCGGRYPCTVMRCKNLFYLAALSFSYTGIVPDKPVAL